MFAIAIIVGIIAFDLAFSFYRVYTAPAPMPTMYVWPMERYIANAGQVAEYKALDIELTAGGYWRTNEHHGHYYNFNDLGERFIPGQPMRYLQTIWIFGNSGAAGFYVSDAEAMAARLQILLPKFRIVNRSTNGQIASGAVAWLKETPVRAGDLVLFVGGKNETIDSYQRALRQASLYAARRGVLWMCIIQPSLEPLPVGASTITLPRSDFIESVHFNARGEADMARALHDIITTF